MEANNMDEYNFDVDSKIDMMIGRSSDYEVVDDEE